MNDHIKKAKSLIKRQFSRFNNLVDVGDFRDVYQIFQEMKKDLQLINQYMKKNDQDYQTMLCRDNFSVGRIQNLEQQLKSQVVVIEKYEDTIVQLQEQVDSKQRHIQKIDLNNKQMNLTRTKSYNMQLENEYLKDELKQMKLKYMQSQNEYDCQFQSLQNSIRILEQNNC